MVINKKDVKYRKFTFYRLLSIVSLKFVGTVFVSLSRDSIILSHVMAKSSIILAKYFLFLQLDVAGRFRIHEVFYTHIGIVIPPLI